MSYQQPIVTISNPCHGRAALVRSLLAFVAIIAAVPAALGAIPWDGEGNDGNWFNPANWNRNENDNNTLPPGSPTVTDTDLSFGTATLNDGLGVIYDTDLPGDTGPDNPFFPVPASVNDPPPDFGYQQIAQLYISRDDDDIPGVTPDNTLTLRGDLDASGPVIVGRSSGVPGTPTNGRIIQESGLLRIPLSNLDLGNAETGSRTGFGNGTYDYRGGRLEISQDGGSGLRLAAGGSGGVGGIGRFIMHNPGPSGPGYVRAYDVNVAANQGNAVILANGTTNGVGIFEFHSNGAEGTRPIQVNRNLIINNGESGTLGSVRSSRLDLVLDAPPMVDDMGVPQDLGLFDVAFSDPGGSSTTGSGSLGDFFSSADASTVYTEGSMVSAMYQGSTYNWTISYMGDITWADADAGVVGSISDTGGVDVVLLGLSSMIVPIDDLTGDFSGNGSVENADLTLLLDNWGAPVPPVPAGWTGDQPTPGAIDNDELTALLDNWGATSGTGAALAAAAVPEPGAIVLALVAALSAACSVRRRCN